MDGLLCPSPAVAGLGGWQGHSAALRACSALSPGIPSPRKKTQAGLVVMVSVGLCEKQNLSRSGGEAGGGGINGTCCIFLFYLQGN